VLVLPCLLLSATYSSTYISTAASQGFSCQHRYTVFQVADLLVAFPILWELVRARVSKLSVSALQQLHPNSARPFLFFFTCFLLCFVHLTMAGSTDDNEHTPPRSPRTKGIWSGFGTWGEEAHGGNWCWCIGHKWEDWCVGGHTACHWHQAWDNGGIHCSYQQQPCCSVEAFWWPYDMRTWLASRA
jgi:hypothetical protein